LDRKVEKERHFGPVVVGERGGGEIGQLEGGVEEAVEIDGQAVDAGMGWEGLMAVRLMRGECGTNQRKKQMNAYRDDRLSLKMF
jgi:hypothetical protein